MFLVFVVSCCLVLIMLGCWRIRWLMLFSGRFFVNGVVVVLLRIGVLLLGVLLCSMLR